MCEILGMSSVEFWNNCNLTSKNNKNKIEEFYFNLKIKNRKQIYTHTQKEKNASSGL